MDKKELQLTLKRASWLLAVFFSIAIVVSAVGKREASIVDRVLVEIEPLSSGNSLIKPEDVQLTIQRSFGAKLEGFRLGAIDVGRIERVLEEDPFVLNADVYIDASANVNVKVEQREPVLRVIDNNGLNYYLDENGLKMPLSRHFAVRVLTATGNIPPHDPNFLERKRHRLKDLFLLAEKISADEFFSALIEQIYVSNTGEFTLIPKVGDQKIIFGKLQDADEKLENLKIFYKEGIPYEGWQKYRTINVKFKGQVVCEKK